MIDGYHDNATVLHDAESRMMQCVIRVLYLNTPAVRYRYSRTSGPQSVIYCTVRAPEHDTVQTGIATPPGEGEKI